MAISRRGFISKGIQSMAGLALAPSFASIVESCISDNPVGPSGNWVELAKAMTGKLVMADDLDFSKVNVQWALAYLSETPEAIALCKSEEDVIACVKWASDHKVPIAARSGGHSYAGYSRSNGLIIDLSQMDMVNYDPNTNYATMEGGAHNLEVYVAGREASVSLCHGRCKGVGVAGLVLGGGIGFNMRNVGLTCDKLVSTRIVIANGEVITASETENPEVFWAIRGAGGGNFGIHTQFVMEMFPVTTVSWFNIKWKENLERVFDVFQELALQAPPEFGVKFSVVAHRGKEDHDKELHIEILGQLVGSEEQLRALLAPVYAVAKPSMETIQELPYWDAQEMLSEDGSPELAHERSRFCFGKVSPEGREAIFRNLKQWPGTSLDANWKYFLMGGRILDLPQEATSFPFREATMITSIDLEWLSNNNDVLEENFEWLDAFHQEMAQYTSPHCYINFIDNREENYLNAYYGQNLERLQAVKRQLDPGNMFSNPKGIPV
jgi:FAD/FMN-containing dehydrogenase